MAYFYQHSHLKQNELGELADTFFFEQIKTDIMTTYDNILAKGKLEGKLEGLSQVAISLFEDGSPIEKIAKITRLDIGHLKEIRTQWLRSKARNMGFEDGIPIEKIAETTGLDIEHLKEIWEQWLRDKEGNKGDGIENPPK